MGGEGYWKFRR